MRSIDFTELGGFPLTQDTLAWLQESYTEALQGIGAIGGGAGPYIISGVTPIAGPSGGTSSGWIYFNGDVYFFGGISLISGTIGMEAIGYVSEADISLVYNDGNARPVMKVKTISFGQVAMGTTLSSTQFLWSDLQTIYTAFGTAGRESSFHNLNVATGTGNGTVTGTINYKKNNITNTLQIKGALSSASPADFHGAASALSSVMGTLATGYRPSQDAPFLCNVLFESLDDAGVDYLRTFEAYIGTDGTINIQWIKPASGVTVTGCLFNALIPLD